jgi:tetratricopeptide (TPR) repeat protein
MDESNNSATTYSRIFSGNERKGIIFFHTVFIAVILILFMAENAMAEAYLEKANKAYGTGNLHKAVRLYKKALAAGENRTLSSFNCANAYFQLDSLPQSIVFYQAAVDAAPDFFRGHLNLAIAYYSLEDVGNCIASIQRALELEPDNKKACLILAASYRKANAYPQAIVAFEQLVHSGQADADVYIALGEMYRELGDLPAACNWLKRYPETGVNREYVLTLLAEIYEQDSIPEKAIYYLQKARDIDGSNRWLHYRICLLHEKNGNRLVALEEAKTSLEQLPDFGDLALFSANCAFKLDRLSEAEHFYEIAREQGCPGAATGLENIRMVRLQRFLEKQD